MYQSDLLANTGTYPLKISVTYDGHSAITATLSFNLEVVKSCLSVTNTLDANAWPDYGYSVGDPILTKKWSDADLTSEATAARCGDWNYSLMNSDGSALDSDLFTLDLTAKNLRVFSRDILKAGVYNVEFKAWQGVHTANGISKVFVVTIINSCPSESPPQYTFDGE